MFKEENRIWWYLLGVLIMLVLLFFFGKDYLLPFLNGDRALIENEPFIYDKAPAFSIDVSSNYVAKIVTNYGTLTVDLYERSAPKNVNNFIFLANKNFYDGTKFYRTIPNFLVQAGDRNTLDNDPGNDGRGRTGYFIQDEVNWDSLNLSTAKRTELEGLGYTSTPGLPSHSLSRYAVAMANTQPDTNSSHFFIITADADDARLRELNGKFTVIGRLISGADVLQSIAAVPVDDPEAHSPRPTGSIVIRDIQIQVR